MSLARKIKKKKLIRLLYKQPKWIGIPSELYDINVLKYGQIFKSFDLNTKSFSMFGCVPTCDIRCHT
jgi:hypothetical protein